MNIKSDIARVSVSLGLAVGLVLLTGCANRSYDAPSATGTMGSSRSDVRPDAPKGPTGTPGGPTGPAGSGPAGSGTR